MDRLDRTTNKIKMLHLVHSLSIGGAEIALFHYIKALGYENYEHYVYCFGVDGPVRDKIESLNVPIRMGKRVASIKRPIRFVFSVRSLIHDLLDFIKSKHIQVIQSHSGKPNQLCIAIGYLSGSVSLPTVHSTMAFIDQRKSWDIRVYLRKAVNKIIYRKAGKVLAVSQEVKEIVVKTYGLKDSKVLVLQNGIIFDDANMKTAYLEKEIPLSENLFKIIAVGRLVPLKCYDVLVQAITEVVNQGFHNVFVIIVGDGEERKKLEQLIKRLKLGSFIKFLGLRNDVLQLMKASDLFVMTSRFEGLSIAMIEAMACGLPIIASDAPGVRGHIKKGKNGLLFPIEDHKALAKIICKLANERDLREKLSYGARESFEREYDMKRNIKPLSMLIQNLVYNQKVQKMVKN